LPGSIETALSEPKRTHNFEPSQDLASDHGLITAFASAPEPIEVADIRARVFEAAVFRHLREVARADHGVLSFGRVEENLEIDFIIRYPGHAVGIEVTSSTDAKPRSSRGRDRP